MGFSLSAHRMSLERDLGVQEMFRTGLRGVVLGTTESGAKGPGTLLQGNSWLANIPVMPRAGTTDKAQGVQEAG